MYNSHRAWLPRSLLYFLFAVPALSARPAPTTPNDPFHAIVALAPKTPEEPICCLKPLTPLEPVGDDLFLSFEDWKAKRFAESSQKSSAPPNASAPTRASSEVPTEPHSSTVVEAADVADPALLMQQNLPPPPPSVPPHFRVPLTDRFNYASLDCSARVHTAHRGAKSASNILSSKRDRYMLSPCAAKPQFVVVELCEDIRIDTVQLANFEFFSGVFKEFTVSVAKTYATDAEGWTVVGTYVGKNVRGVQSFHPPTSIRDFYRYIRVDFHSHYSNEYYCPISLLRVYGLTHLEQWKWDTWEEESKARQDLNVPAVAVPVESLIEPPQPATAPQDALEVSSIAGDGLPSATPSDEVNAEAQDHQKDGSQSSEGVEGSFRHSTDIARLEPSTSAPNLATTADPSLVATPSPIMSPDYTTVSDDPAKRPHVPSGDNAPAAFSPVSVPSRSTDASASTAPTSPPVRSQSHFTVITTPSPSITSASSASGSASASSPPIINLPPPAPPAHMQTGESIYRTIMNRLSALEANTTLYARYVEEQTSAMREMLRRLSEDVGRLEGIGRAQAHLYERSVLDFEKHRKRMDVEHRALLSQVNYLADEIVLEKRLGIAQLCLLLAVLVFLSVTRGSPGEFHASTTRGANPMRAWGRRSLNLSGDWVARLRSVSTSRSRASSNGETTPVVAPAPAAPPIAPTQSNVTTTPTTSHQRRPGAYANLTPTLRPLTPSLRRAGPGSGNGPRPRVLRTGPASPAAGGIQRSTSHAGAPLIGPVPRSARRWARSAHLHEVRRVRNVDGDVFGPGSEATSAGLAKGSGSPGAAAFALGGKETGGRTASPLREYPSGPLRIVATQDEDEHVNGGADAWVDTDTDTDLEGDAGLSDVDAEWSTGGTFVSAPGHDR